MGLPNVLVYDPTDGQDHELYPCGVMEYYWGKVSDPTKFENVRYWHDGEWKPGPDLYFVPISVGLCAVYDRRRRYSTSLP